MPQWEDFVAALWVPTGLEELSSTLQQVQAREPPGSL
jgi:hypothetical protein